MLCTYGEIADPKRPLGASTTMLAIKHLANGPTVNIEILALSNKSSFSQIGSISNNSTWDF